MTTKRTRKELQGLFKQGAMPSGTDFSDFIYSCINLKEDGLEKPVGTDQPLKITSQGEEENILDLYSKSNEWTYRLNQISSEGEPGLNLKIPAGNSRLFVEGNTGKIGINTDAPKAKLHIKQTDNSDALRIEDADKDATPFVIDSEGNVGIGNSEPKASLDVNGNVRLSKDKTVLFEDNGSIKSADNNHGIFFRRTENKMEFREFGDLIFSPGSQDGKETSKCIMTSDGNLGIGVNSPRSRLDIGFVKDGAIGAVFGRQQEGDTENEGTFLGVKGYETQNKKYGGKGFSIEHSFYGHTNSAVNFYRGGNREGGFLTFSTNKNEEKMRISSGGNVGIGTSDPKSKLEVAGDIHSLGLTLKNGVNVSEITKDGNLKGNSDSTIPTEKAVKTYIDTRLPKGVILMWSGSKAPSGWAICDGNNETPDLQNRFILGAGKGKIGGKGGEESHLLSIDEMPTHNHGGSSKKTNVTHSHGMKTWQDDYNCSGNIKTNKYPSFGSDQGSNRVFHRTENENINHNHVINAQGGSKAHNNMPPYYILAYIMKL